MSVEIRLSRLGRKKHPFYRLVAAKKGAKRDGRFLEILGTFDPNKSTANVDFKADRIKAWIGVGANCSDTASQLIEKEIPGYLSGLYANRIKKVQEKRKARKARAKKN